MRRTILVGLIAAVLAVAAPRRAQACGQGGGNYSGLQALAVTALVVGGADAIMTLYDGGSALVSHQPSAGYGIFETAIAGPQVLLGLAGLGNSTGSAQQFFAAYTIWMGLLTVHGIWTI